MKSKMKFSIQSKLLIYFIAIVSLSIGVFLYFALDLFYKDKTAYIFDSNLEKSGQIAQELASKIKNYQQETRDLLTIYHLTPDKNVFRDYVKTKQYFLEFQFYDQSGVIGERIITGSSDRTNLDENFLNKIRSRKMDITYLLKDSKQPLLQLALYDPLLQEILVAKIEASSLTALFSSKIFQGVLITDDHQYLFSQDPALNQSELSQLVQSTKARKGVFDIKLKQENFLLAFAKIPELGINVATLIKKSLAFTTAEALINKSYGIAILIISLSIGLGVFMSRSLTKPIDRLMEGTKQVAAGNFAEKVEVNSKDELAVLADSFNYMSGEIIRYMEEVKDKVRMENELAVAQLVQASFFPHDHLQFGKFKVHAHFQSASECGGDWWGSFRIQEKNLLLIGDATGHGVPAALVTATANCCSNLLGELTKNRPELLQSPALILEIMNETIFRLGGKIVMTFFLAIHDEKTNSLVYSNASHNTPLLYRYNTQEASKEDVYMLDLAIGSSLGSKEKAVYQNAKIDFFPQDVLVLYTDGITEAENPKNRQYGERYFIKSLLKVAKDSPDKIVSSMVQDAFEYYEGVIPNDDITLVVAKLGS